VDIDKIHSDLLGKSKNIQLLEGYNTADKQKKEYPYTDLEN